MAAWNVTICSFASSLLSKSSKNRVEQALGMAPSPQVSPGTTRGGVAEQHQYGAKGQNHVAQKRGYYTAFAEQMADEEMVVEEEIMGGAGGVELKKRRLTMDQVRFLESSFESENRLEPERKVQIAQRLGLQPRQVAVWFQNRRARSKSKQLERDFLALKADYDAVLVENEKLQAEVDRLTAQLREGRASAADCDIAEKDDGQHQELVQDASPKTSASSSSNSPSFQSDDHAEKGPPTAMSASITPDDELREEHRQLRQPCAILADVDITANLSAATVPSPPPSAARDCAGLHDAPFFLGDDYQCLGSFVQQACAAHQLVDLCADAFLYDSSLFVNAIDDPWVDS